MNKYKLNFEKIENWINSVNDENLSEKFVELHIDQVLNVNLVKGDWIPLSETMFDFIIRYVGKYNIKLRPCLIISLFESSEYMDCSLGNLSELMNDADDSPPAFYLFPLEQKPWQVDESEKKLKDLHLFQNLTTSFRYYYSSFRVENFGFLYTRNVWCVPML